VRAKFLCRLSRRKSGSETDPIENLKMFYVPTLIMHGDNAQIVPIDDTAMLSAKIAKDLS
jgi:non-heme chloroperoxidase